MKKKKPLWLKILLTILILGVVACVWEFVSSQNPYILPVRRALKYDVLHLSPWSDRKIGIDAEYTHYVDGAVSADGQYVRGADNKRVYDAGDWRVLVNYLDGYQMGFPTGAEFDFSRSPLYTRVTGNGWDAVISRERATYEGMKDVISFELGTFFPFLHSSGVQNYVNHYELRFLQSPEWQTNNRVRLVDMGGDPDELIWRQFEVDDPGDAEYEVYFYAFIYTGSREYIRVALRCHNYDVVGPSILPWIERAVQPENFLVFDPTGVGHYDTDFSPDLDAATLSDETRALYDELQNGDTLKWGIFTSDAFTNLGNSSMEEIERELDYTFDAALIYVHYGHDFPTEFMEGNYQRGRIVELTYQVTENNNEDMFAHTPFLDMYRGECDDEIRRFARAAAEYGHPFLFRLNNEMNSDWTSYSGVVNMADPQLYIDVWRRFYRIFREEGVNNCLWIYNPNDRNAPPSKWNDSLAFYPGNGYVQLLGVTGYNNGTYYTKWNEQWRDFTTIYDEIWTLYEPHFSRFPWIITEFASSSYGGDKTAWIDEMFAHIGDYPNIKLAVWFSAADYDGETPARPYWLDETPETLAAFRRGLHPEN